MIFLGKKVRGRAIKHPLGQVETSDGHLKDVELPPPIEAERLGMLVRRLRFGDKSAHEEIIMGHARLAVSIASKYATLTTRSIEDLVQEAMLAVTYAVKRAQHKLVDDNITPFISSQCHSFVYRFITLDKTVPIDRQTIAQRKKRGLTTEVRPTVEYVEKLSPNARNPTAMLAKQGPMLDTYELLEMSAETDLENKIVELRLRGYNDTEIAEQLGLSHQYICMTRAKIKRRFERLEDL